MAPCDSDKSSLGTMSSGSKYIEVPKPLQVGQAPCGLLKENIRGLSSGYEIPHTTQANFWLKSISSWTAGPSPKISTLAISPPCLKATSSESAKRFSIPG